MSKWYERKDPQFLMRVWVYSSIALMSFFQLFFVDLVYSHQLLLSDPWRLWTGHWVHLGVWHWTLNIVALAILPEIFLRASWKFFLLLWMALPPLLSLTLWALLPHLSLYAGLSGVLHGLYMAMAMTAIVSCAGAERKVGWIILIGLSVKVSWEAYSGNSQTSELIGAPVILQAHQWGAALGLCLWLVARFVSYIPQKQH